MGDVMKSELLEFNGYLCIKRAQPLWKNKLSGRLVTSAPSLHKGEIAVKVTVSVPKSLFIVPQLRAEIRIPESSVTPPTVDAQVLDNVREVLEQQTGMEINVSVIEPTAVQSCA
jgi:hypothetical protein